MKSRRDELLDELAKATPDMWTELPTEKKVSIEIDETKNYVLIHAEERGPFGKAGWLLSVFTFETALDVTKDKSRTFLHAEDRLFLQRRFRHPLTELFLNFDRTYIR